MLSSIADDSSYHGMLLRGCSNIEDKIAAYIGFVGIGAVWGGFDTLIAVSEMYKVKIVVYNVDGSTIPITPSAVTPTRTLRVFYTGNHYNSIVWEDDLSNAQPSTSHLNSIAEEFLRVDKRSIISTPKTKDDLHESEKAGNGPSQGVRPAPVTTTDSVKQKSLEGLAIREDRTKCTEIQKEHAKSLSNASGLSINEATLCKFIPEDEFRNHDEDVDDVDSVSDINQDTKQSSTHQRLKTRRPAQPTERTTTLGIKLEFDFSLKRSDWDKYYIPGKKSISNWTEDFKTLIQQGNKYCVLVFKNNKVRTVPHSEDLRFTGTAFCKYPNCFAFSLSAVIRPCSKTDDSKGDDDIVFQNCHRPIY